MKLQTCFPGISSRDFGRKPITVIDRVVVELQQGKGAGRG